METLNFKKSLIIILSIIFCEGILAQAGFGEIRGMIKNKDNETVPFATIKIVQGDLLIGGTQSDEEGRYNYKPLTPGSYDMVVMEAGHQTQPVNKIKIIPNEATYVNVRLTANTLATITVTAKPVEYTQSGVDKNMYSMKSIDSRELLQNASIERGNIKSAITANSADAIEKDGEIHIRGARGNSTSYYIDGVKTMEANSLPGLAIENITYFTGGVPAMYGDLTSGAVIVTTKSYFSGIREKNIRQAEYREKQAAKKAAENKNSETDLFDIKFSE